MGSLPIEPVENIPFIEKDEGMGTEIHDSFLDDIFVPPEEFLYDITWRGKNYKWGPFVEGIGLNTYYNPKFGNIKVWNASIKKWNAIPKEEVAKDFEILNGEKPSEILYWKVET
jgi:hypothetical protein